MAQRQGDVLLPHRFRDRVQDLQRDLLRVSKCVPSGPHPQAELAGVKVGKIRRPPLAPMNTHARRRQVARQHASGAAHPTGQRFEPPAEQSNKRTDAACARAASSARRQDGTNVLDNT